MRGAFRLERKAIAMPAHDWTRVEDGIFHSFHLSWISRIYDGLNAGLLPANYYALAEQHAGETVPDILTLHRRDSDSETGGSSASSPGGGGSALLLEEAPPRVAIVTEFDADVYARLRRTLTIRHVTDDTLVAMIEIVSPGNKSSRHAFDQFLEKVLAALDHGIHLLIADLHPRTPRDPDGIHAAIADALGKNIGNADLNKPLTLVSYRAASDRRGYAQPFAVGDRLAEMPLFLTAESYVNVPLEETYESAFSSIPKHLRDVLEHST
jgi:hypothetical protein